MTHTFDRAAGTTVIGRQASQFATAPGLPASESTLARVYGSAQGILTFSRYQAHAPWMSWRRSFDSGTMGNRVDSGRERP